MQVMTQHVLAKENFRST